MKKDTVTRIDKKQILSVNAELEAELAPLDDARFAYLRTAIKRDGVLDAVKYWTNPVNGKCEIIDGHHRHKIAKELGVLYNVQEIDFAGKTITAVKYWMHINQSGRRGSEINLARMAELRTQLASEQGETVSKSAVAREVAKDAKVSERTVWRDLAGEQPSKPGKSPIEKAKAELGKLDRDAIREIIVWLQDLLD